MGGRQSSPVPESMRRVVLVAPNADMSKAQLRVEDNVPLPVPRSGEVLVKVDAAPVNPSDYGEWCHVPHRAATEPVAIGKEGSGTVVASGGGFYANSCVGKRVGFCNLPKGQGAYSEYVTVSAMEGVFALPDAVATEDAASHFVNPYTAYGIVDTVRSRHGKAAGAPGFIHTAAASQLGQMLVKLCAQTGVTLINVVRRQEQAEQLRALGAEIVVVSGTDGWEEQLRQLVKQHGIRVAFDAVAGEMTGALLSLLPARGTVFVYGRLSNKGCSEVQPLDLIYRKKKVEGWLLPSWLRQGGIVSTLMRLRAATACVHGGLSPGGWAASRFADCSLDTMWPTFLDMYQNTGFTNRKLRIRMQPQATEIGPRDAGSSGA